MFIDQRMAVKKTIAFPTVYTEGSDIDANALKDQKVVPVAATGNFSATPGALGNRVMLGRGTEREEEGTIDSLSAGVSITLDDNLTYNHTVDAATTVDVESAAAQKVLSVAATTNFAVGEKVVVDSGESHEATYTIASIASGVSLTMVEDLEHTHEVDEAVAQTGIGGVVEVCWAGHSEVIDKSGYQNMSIYLPSTWTTAAITLLGCDSMDGTFLQVVNADDVGETTIASVAASKYISLNGEIRDAMAAIPFLKLRSGVSGTEIDQGKGSPTVTVVLTR